MGRPTLNVESSDLGSISRSRDTITIRTRIHAGPREVIGRASETVLDPHAITFILTTLATMPAYTHVFRAIADELETRERIFNDPDAGPVARMANELDSHNTHNRLTRIIEEIRKETPR